MANPVLVTSAAGGRQGKTGRHVSEMLLKRGIPVRAFVHKIDERSDHLRALGAEIFEGDFLDVRSVQRAVQGVSAVYFAYPVQDGLLDATAAMAVAAHEAGISRLVNLVMLQSSVDAPTPRMRQNYLSEQVFEWAGIGAVHIRATLFYENLGSQVRQSLPSQGAVRLPWGKETTVLPLVAAEDVARVAVGLLTSPSLTAGTAYPVIGTVISLKEIIATAKGQRKAKGIKRLKVISAFNRRNEDGRAINSPMGMILDAIPVIPPDLRPMVQLDGPVRDLRPERPLPPGHQPQQPVEAPPRPRCARDHHQQREAHAPRGGRRPLRQRSPWATGDRAG